MIILQKKNAGMKTAGYIFTNFKHPRYWHLEEEIKQNTPRTNLLSETSLNMNIILTSVRTESSLNVYLR